MNKFYQSTKLLKKFILWRWLSSYSMFLYRVITNKCVKYGNSKILFNYFKNTCYKYVTNTSKCKYKFKAMNIFVKCKQNVC